MAKDKISDYSTTANSNTDIGGINVDEGCAPSGINDAIRTLMAQLKTWQSGGQDVYIHPAGSASAPSITANGDTNTGIFFPAADTVGISTGGTERARVDSAGNLGLGVTPSAWSGCKAFELSGVGSAIWSTGTSDMRLSSNVYFDGTNAKYAVGNLAGQYRIASGVHQWFNAASGTAGNAITFTQAMTLDASGNFMVGGTGYTAAKITSVQQSDTAGTLSFGLGAGGGVSQGLRLTSGNALAFDRYNGGWYESARIDSSGNLLVGTTTRNTARANFYNTARVINVERDTTSSATQIVFINPNGDVGSISTSGSSTSYGTSSDYRLKNSVAPMTGALAKVAALKPCTYKWNADGSDGEGFIAHELAEVCPHAVTGEKDAVETYTDEEGNEQTRPVYQGIDTSFLVATLTAAIQELKATVDAQAARITALEQA
jgi:hypothetical protein